MEQKAVYRWWPDGAESSKGKAAVRAVLEGHPGARNAVTSERLAREVGLSTRKVRALIVELVEEGLPVGASVDGTRGGYYLIQSEEELEQTRAILRGRAREIFARDRALCRAWAQVGGPALQPLLPTMASSGADGP